MFFDGESSPIIFHFITDLELLISHKVDKQLSMISLNRGEATGTNTRERSVTRGLNKQIISVA